MIHQNQKNMALLTVPKVFETIMHRQMSIFVEKLLSPYMYWYRKGFSTQETLLLLIETWKKCLTERDVGVQYLWIF